MGLRRSRGTRMNWSSRRRERRSRMIWPTLRLERTISTAATPAAAAAPAGGGGGREGRGAAAGGRAAARRYRCQGAAEQPVGRLDALVEQQPQQQQADRQQRDGSQRLIARSPPPGRTGGSPSRAGVVSTPARQAIDGAAQIVEHTPACTVSSTHRPPAPPPAAPRDAAAAAA